jgi:hypothetical protein
MLTDMVSLIEHQLTKKQWSPEQIAGILAANGASVMVNPLLFGAKIR